MVVLVANTLRSTIAYIIYVVQFEVIMIQIKAFMCDVQVSRSHELYMGTYMHSRFTWPAAVSSFDVSQAV